MNKNSQGTHPLISVIMGIYNCADTLPEALDSIRRQTVSDWELILCDDGSTDGTYDLVCGLRDEIRKDMGNRVIVLKNSSNRGLNHTLNRCLRHARGSFIARMDGDDRCAPDRFEKELDAFRKEPDLAIVSSDMEFFDERGVFGKVSHPSYPKKEDFLKGSPFCHAPCLVRREAMLSVGGYSEAKRLLRVEDYHLWIKLYAKGYRGRNIHEPLYQMRDDRNAASRRKFRYRLNEAYVILYGIRALHLPGYDVVFTLRPIVVGLLPTPVYMALHRRRLGNKSAH